MLTVCILGITLLSASAFERKFSEDSADDQNHRMKRITGPGCFSGDSKVITPNGEITIRELIDTQDARVLSRNSAGGLEFSPVEFWLHADHAKKHNFLTFSLENGVKLTATDYHLLYETDCKGVNRTVFAVKVKSGNCLCVRSDRLLIESKIIGIERSTKTGVYAPITTNGNLVVNGVLASCFTNFEDEQIQKNIFSTYITMRRTVEKILPGFLHGYLFGSTGQVPEFILSILDMSQIFMQ